LAQWDSRIALFLYLGGGVGHVPLNGTPVLSIGSGGLIPTALSADTFGPGPLSDRFDIVWPTEEGSPSIAACIEDGVVVFEDTVCEVVLAQELPDVLDGIEFGRVGRQRQQRDVGRQIDDGLLVIAGAIHDQDGMGARRDGTADRIEMRGHRLGIGAR